MLRSPSIHPFTLLGLFVFIELFSCKAAESNPANADASFTQLVQSKLGTNYTVEYSGNRQYALCQQKRSENDHARRNFRYVVIRLSENKVVNEGVFVLGYAKWIDNNSIEVATSTEGSDKLDVRKILIENEN